MEKIQFSDLNTSRKVLLSKSETSLIYKLENGEYIGEDVLRLSYDYDMYVSEFNGGYLKRLERKRKM